MTLSGHALVQPREERRHFIPIRQVALLREMGEELAEGILTDATERTGPGAAGGGVVREGLGSGVELRGEIAHRGGRRRNQGGAAGLRRIEEELDHAATRSPAGEDEGGGAEIRDPVGHIVVDEVVCGLGKERSVPVEEDAGYGGRQVGSGWGWGLSRPKGAGGG